MLPVANVLTDDCPGNLGLAGLCYGNCNCTSGSRASRHQDPHLAEYDAALRISQAPSEPRE